MLLGKCDGFQEFSSGEVDYSHRLALKFVGVQPGESILDIGCGRGETVRECSKITDKVVGIDQSAAAVSISARFTGQGKILRAGATDLPFKTGVFDKVSMLGFIECLSRDEVSSCLDECRRVLKGQGTLLIATPNSLGNVLFDFVSKSLGWFYPPIRTRSDPKGWRSSPFFRSSWNFFSLRKQLKKHGFRARIKFEPPKTGPIMSLVHRVLFFTAPMYCRAYRYTSEPPLE